MPVDMEDMKAIREQLDPVYETKEHFHEVKEEIESKFSRDDKRIEIIAKDMDLFKRIGWLLVATGLGQLVVMFFGVIK